MVVKVDHTIYMVVYLPVYMWSYNSRAETAQLITHASSGCYIEKARDSPFPTRKTQFYIRCMLYNLIHLSSIISFSNEKELC